MQYEIVATGKLVAGHGTIPHRIVLRMAKNDAGRPTEFVVHSQSFQSSDCGFEKTQVSYMYGHYFPVSPTATDEQIVEMFLKAHAKFQECDRAKVMERGYEVIFGSRIPPLPLVCTLQDVSDKDKEMNFEITVDSRGIEIRPEGYGVYGMENGTSGPIYIEVQNGEPRVIVWTDINHEDPQEVVCLSGANESLRNPA